MHFILSSSHPSRDPFFLCLTSGTKEGLDKEGGLISNFGLRRGGLNEGFSRKERGLIELSRYLKSCLFGTFSLRLQQVLHDSFLNLINTDTKLGRNAGPYNMESSNQASSLSLDKKMPVLDVLLSSL